MKNLILISAIISLFIVSCKKDEIKTIICDSNETLEQNTVHNNGIDTAHVLVTAIQTSFSSMNAHLYYSDTVRSDKSLGKIQNIYKINPNDSFSFNSSSSISITKLGCK